jgi:hypothetical protein
MECGKNPRRREALNMKTEIILSPAPELRPAPLHADAEGRETRAGILHRSNQQRPHT